MSGPLALVGGAEFRPGNEPQDERLAAAAGGGPAFVLATAAARQNPGAAVRTAQRWFAGIGLEVEELPVLRRSHAASPEIAARAATGRFFYLVGGDPGLVVDVLLGSRLWDAVADAWRGGAALAGSSAGAMALCGWTLIRDGPPGGRRRRFKEALGVVPGSAVLPHFGGFGRQWVPSVLEAAPPGDVTLVGLDERTAAVWDGDAWTALGAGSVTLIGAGGVERSFAPGERLDGLPAPR